MTEASHLMPSSGLASDPVLYGVAQGLSQLFPPVEHPNGVSVDDATGQDSDDTDAMA